MKVNWSDKAKSRLHEIHDFVAIDSPIRAKQVVDRLTRRSEKLALHPRPERRVPEYFQDDLREVLEPPFRIIYLINADQIDIVTVKHYRQRLPERPADL